MQLVIIETIEETFYDKCRRVNLQKVKTGLF